MYSILCHTVSWLGITDPNIFKPSEPSPELLYIEETLAAYRESNRYVFVLIPYSDPLLVRVSKAVLFWLIFFHWLRQEPLFRK